MKSSLILSILFVSAGLAIVVPGLAYSQEQNETIRFAILGDRTGNAVEGVYGQIISEVERLKPDFVITVGDMIEGYTNDTARLNSEWDSLFALTDQLSMPIYFTPGNHDITFDGMEATYKNRVGKPYYSFDYKSLHLIILDNSRNNQTSEFDSAQLVWLKADLETNSDTEQTIVFMHKPFWYMTTSDNKPDTLHKLFKAFGVDAVFTGHFHRYFSGEYDGILYTSLGSAGGRAKKNPHGMKFHFTWVTVENGNFHIAPIKKDAVKAWDFQTADEMRVINAVENKAVTFPKPVAVNDDLTVSGATLSVNVENLLSDIKVTDSLRWDCPEGWSVEPLVQEFTVGPKASKTLNFNVESSGDLYPAPFLNVDLSYDSENKTLVSKFLPFVRQVTARRTEQSPIIDGELNESIWSNPVRYLFAGDGKRSACDPIDIYFAYDSENLYLAVRCTEKEMDKLKAEFTERDDAVYGEDCFGIMFQPLNDNSSSETAPTYQVYTNPNGAIYDQRITVGTDGYWNGNNSWNGDYDVKTSRTDSYWAMELKIPLAQFDAKPTSGDSWRMNFRRKQARLGSAAGLHIPWSYNPSTFGEILFE